MNGLRDIAYAALLRPSPLERYYARPSRRIEREGVVFVSGDEDDVAVVVGPMTPQRLFALTDAFFEGGVYVVVDVDCAPLVDEALRAADWVLDEEEQALVLAPIPVSPPPLPGLDIRRVATQQGLDDYFAVTRTSRRYIPSLAAALDPDVALFVGYVDGAPVATSRVSCLDEVGDLMGVVTEDVYRRRGIGTAMTWAAIEAARQRGCTAITLSATEMGLPIYQRMGFVYACTLRTYLPPSAAETTEE